jgi:phage anti-repressor protein
MASTSVTEEGDELHALLKSELTGAEQQLFVDGFHAYMTYDARTDFVVNLDNVYEWLGFTRRDNAKRLVHKHLAYGVHFKTDFSGASLLLRSEEQTSDPRGGHNKEDVRMTVHGFKQLCMAANTDKSRRIRDYYIAMEEVMFEYTKRKMEQAQMALTESRVAMETKDAVIKAQEDELERFKTKTFEEPPKFDHVYVFKDLAETCSDVHKIGNSALLGRLCRPNKAIDPEARKKQLSTGSARGIEEVYKRRTHNAGVVERIVHVAQKRYHVGSIGGREHYNNSMQHSIDNIDIACVFVETLSGSFELMSKEAKIAKIVDTLQCMLTDEPQAEESSCDNIQDSVPPICEHLKVHDSVQEFIVEACITGPCLKVSSDEALNAFNKHRIQNGLGAVSSKWLVQGLKAKGFDKKQIRINRRGGIQGYVGFQLK